MECNNCHSGDVVVERYSKAACCLPTMEEEGFNMTCLNCGEQWHQITNKGGYCGRGGFCMLPIIIAGIGFAAKAWAFISDFGLK